MSAFFVLKFYCIPPDVSPVALQRMLQASEADVKRASVETPFPDIPVGIALVSDLSDYLIGDMIWAEGEFRGHHDVRGIQWGTLDRIAQNITRGLDGLVLNHVNTTERLNNPQMAQCGLISATIGSENGPVTATRSKIIRD